MGGEELLQLISSGDQDAFIAAWNKASGQDKDRFSDLMYSTISSTGATPAQSKEAYRKILRDQSTADTFTSALKTGVGLTQVIAGFFEKGKVERPVDPPITAKNTNLAALQGIATSKATGNDPNNMELFESKLASGQAIDSANARATGTVGQYTGNIQGASARRDKATREFINDEDRRQMGWMGQAGSLTAQSIREDQNQFEQMMQQFSARMQEYAASKNNLQAQINSGVGNVFAGLEEGSKAFPYFKGSAPGSQMGESAPFEGMPSGPFDGESYDYSKTGSFNPSGANNLSIEGTTAVPIEKSNIGKVDMSLFPKATQSTPSSVKPTKYDGIMAMAGVIPDEKVVRGFQEQAIQSGFDIPIMELGSFGPNTKKFLESLNY
jgi:hypothetical protein